MSAAAQARHGGAGLAIRGVALEAALSWFFVLAILMGIIAAAEFTSSGRRHDPLSPVLIQVLSFGSLWITRLPSSRLLLCLPQSGKQTETTLWAVSFAVPVAYYVLVFGSGAVWSGWHGRSTVPSLMMLLDGVAMQGLLVLAASFRPDKAGRIGWAGWTRRSALWLGVALGMAGVALCMSPGFVPRHYAHGALELACATGLPAALLVCVRRDVLLRRHPAITSEAHDTSGTVRAWPAFILMLLPWIIFTIVAAVALPALLVVATRGAPQFGWVIVASPLLLSVAVPAAILPGVRAIRALPVSATTLSALLTAAMVIGPCATCLFLAAAAGEAPFLRGAVATYTSWIVPATAVSMVAIPLTLRFERLWVVQAFTVLMICGLAAGVGVFSRFILPPLPLGADLLACTAAAAGNFLWLRQEIAATRGIQFRIVQTT